MSSDKKWAPKFSQKGQYQRADSLDPTTDPEGIGMNNRPNMATNLDNAFGSLGVATSTSEDVKNVNMRSYEDGIKFPFRANMIGTGCKSNLIGSKTG